MARECTRVTKCMSLGGNCLRIAWKDLAEASVPRLGLSNPKAIGLETLGQELSRRSQAQAGSQLAPARGTNQKSPFDAK